MVIMLEIGQSAGKEPKLVMFRVWFSLNDWSPFYIIIKERKRMWVINDGLNIQRLLKV
jgi:hypothetical protein